LTSLRLIALIAAAASVTVALPSSVRAQTPPPMSPTFDHEAEANRAESWALYGVFVPIGAATAVAIVTNPSEKEVGTPVLATIGGLWALGGLWGTSVGYYRAGQPLTATLLGLGKTALLGGCVLLDRKAFGSGSSMSTEGGSGMPIFTVLGVVAVVVWDVRDYFALGRSIRERSPPATASRRYPIVLATSHAAIVGLGGRF
jgi:hypothetical protein